MNSKPSVILLCTSLLLPTVSFAGEIPAIAPIPNATAPTSTLPDFDFLRVVATQTGDMDLEKNSGDLSISNFEFRAILSEPISIGGGIDMIPIFTYDLTSFDFSGANPFPINDEDLHSISLQSFFVRDFQNSPWFAVAWTRAEMATDFQGIEGDDFTFDVAAGLGYRFSDTFTLAFGFAVTNLNGDATIYPGINFDWIPCENVRIGLYGPNIQVTYNINNNWFLSLDGQPGGGSWNVNDNFGKSRTVELDSYWLGINTHHRIAGELWLSAGIGYTFANEIQIHGNHGNGPSTSRDMDGAPLAQISLSLHRW